MAFVNEYHRRFFQLVWLWLMLTLGSGRKEGLKIDADNLDNCPELAKDGNCIQDDHTYFQCPIACARHHRDLDRLRLPLELPDADFYDVTGVKLATGKAVDMSRYDGYVTIVAVVPLVAGLAQYSIDMLEHIHTVYPYTLEIVVLPMVVKNDILSNPHRGELKYAAKSKIAVWETIEFEKEGQLPSDQNKVLELFEQSPKEPGSFYKDRVVQYVVSYDGDKVDKRVSANIIDLERIAGHYIRGGLKGFTRTPEF